MIFFAQMRETQSPKEARTRVRKPQPSSPQPQPPLQPQPPQLLPRQQLPPLQILVQVSIFSELNDF